MTTEQYCITNTDCARLYHCEVAVCIHGGSTGGHCHCNGHHGKLLYIETCKLFSVYGTGKKNNKREAMESR